MVASPADVWVNCKVVDQHGASASYCIAVYDPYSEPDLYLNSFGGDYSFLIQTDGNGWYQAINGTDGSIYSQSTNSSYVFNSCTNIAGTTTYVLNGLYIDDSRIMMNDNTTLIGQGWGAHIMLAPNAPYWAIST